MSETLSSYHEATRQPQVVAADSHEGKAVLQLVYNAGPLMEDQPDTGKEGLDRLQSKLFLNTSHIDKSYPELVVNAVSADSPIQVPLDLVIDAQGFAGWEGRHKGVNKTISTDDGYETLPSRQVVIRYANKQTEPPPIPEFDMFIQPNGKIFFANTYDGSHRLAAAILKGRKSVPTYSVRVHHITDEMF